MSQPVMQHAFHAGEWAPQLNARVDLQKYHAGAAVLRNFFVDYRGGASTRVGTKYVLQAFKSATQVRLIPFEASFSVNYVLEFGDFYIRFHINGAPVVEAATTISGATNANPGVITDTAHGYSNGDWIFISNVVGMTQLNNRYFIVANATANTYTLQRILDGSNVDTTGYSAYTSGGTAQRVFTLPSIYAASELALLKFAQDVNTLILTHANHPPYVLTLVSATNWTLTQIAFGSTVATPPTPTVTSTLAAGSVNYAYVITAVDNNGQESAPSAFGTLASKTDLRVVSGTNVVTWTAVPGAQSYNVYKAEVSYAGAIPAGSQFGFIGNVTGLNLADSNINPDFSQTPPVVENPFQGSGVASYTVTASGAPQTVVPSVTVAAPSAGSQATAAATLGATSVTINQAGTGYSVGQIVSLGVSQNSTSLLTVKVTSVGGGGTVTGIVIVYPGSITGVGVGTPANPLQDINGLGGSFSLKVNVTWGVTAVTPISNGTGYTSPPAVSFSPAGAAATAVLGTAAAGNPSAVAFFQQRLVLAAPPGAVNTFYMSQPGSFFNFNTTDPVEADDAITGSIRSAQLNTIKSMVPLSQGLLTFTDHQAWLVNGGSQNAAITPIDATANGQAYNGASDVPPIPVNFDILYVQSKGSIVRDLTFNFYTSIYTGTDITVLSSHLFFGFKILEWAYAEEPFKLIWAVRSDGALLSLTFVKEQEVVGWAHHDTQGLFNSICSVVEGVSVPGQGLINVDAVYVVVIRNINGNNVRYIERLADRFLGSYNDSSVWCVDAGLQYVGTPNSVFRGLDHLAGMTITGLADGQVIPNTVISADGQMSIGTPASVVTIGLSYLCQLQTLPLDTGEPTVQGKRKRLNGFTVRCQKALGLLAGRTFATLVTMKDLVLGNIGTMSNAQVTDLVTGDARTIMDPLWDVYGQCCIQQSKPYPATVLGVIPEVTVGDTP